MRGLRHGVVTDVAKEGIFRHVEGEHLLRFRTSYPLHRLLKVPESATIRASSNL